MPVCNHNALTSPRALMAHESPSSCFVVFDLDVGVSLVSDPKTEAAAAASAEADIENDKAASADIFLG